MLGNYFIATPPQTARPAVGIAEAIADEAIATGQSIYLKNNGNCALASATGFPQCEVAGLAISNSVAGRILYYSSDTSVGHNNWTSSNNSILLTMGTTYWLSETPGQITSIAPSTEFKIKIGRASSSSVLDIEIEIPKDNIYEAAVNISAYKLVGLNSDGKLIIADATLQILPIGMLLRSVVAGDKTIITVQSVIYNNNWNWTPNKNLFLADNGDISLTPATVGIFVPVGRSLSNQRINFDATLEHYYLG